MRFGIVDQTMSGERSDAATVQTARLLWEACRPAPDPAAVRRTLDDGADLSRAVASAAQHRLVPLLWRALVSAKALDQLGAERDDLAAAADAFHMEALLLIPRAVALAIRPLTDAGLEPVVLKGPEVASRYPAPGLRPMEDIDLLLPQADHPRALDALQGVGWQVARAAGVDLYDTVLTHPEVPSLLLELHYGLERTTQRVTALDPLALWERRQPTECAGTPAFRLPLTEELVVLAAHAGKPHHRFVRLIWIADLAMVAHDAAERGTRSTGAPCTVSPARHAVPPSSASHSPWPDGRVSQYPMACSRCRRAAGGARRCDGCCRRPGRSPMTGSPATDSTTRWVRPTVRDSA